MASVINPSKDPYSAGCPAVLGLGPTGADRENHSNRKEARSGYENERVHVKMLALLLAVAIMVVTLALPGNGTPDPVPPTGPAETPRSGPDAGGRLSSTLGTITAPSPRIKPRMNAHPKFEEGIQVQGQRRLSSGRTCIQILISANSNLPLPSR